MATLRDKVQNALDESRILILGVQVLLGWEYRSVFEWTVGVGGRQDEWLMVLALGAHLLALGALVAPVGYHRIVEAGEDSVAVFHFVKLCTGRALLPFAIGMAVELHLAAVRIGGRRVGLAVSSLLFGAMLGAWYGLEYWIARRVRSPDEKRARELRTMKQEAEREPTGLDDKIRQVLTEARMVLPGAQALLGFQLASTLTPGFDAIARSSRWVHLVSLMAIAISTILLVAPAAYHRIVEHGENTERFLRFASRIVLLAMVPLAIGLAGDLFVVVAKASGSELTAAIAATVALLFFGGFWFGWMYWKARSVRAAPTG